MTEIEIKDVITLSDNNKYVVCSKINYQDENYLYLIDMVDNTNIKFGLENKHNQQISIIEVENQEFIATLLPLFLDEAKAY